MIEWFFNDWLMMMNLSAGILFGALFWAVFSMVTKVLNIFNIEMNFSLCEVCVTFWMTLALTFNPFIAAGAALTKWWIEKNDVIEL
jgi:hypothetical protein